MTNKPEETGRMLGPSRDCARCGETFLLGRLGRKGNYCSRNCRQRAYEERRALALLAPLLGAAPGYAPARKPRARRAAGGDTSLEKHTADDHEAAPGPETEG
jgi:hypothetical protein